MALIAKEALTGGGAEALLAALDTQEPWSDLPVLLLTLPESSSQPHILAVVRVLERANVTLLQRPIPSRLLVSAVRSALRARRRQYETRDLLEDLKRAVELSELFVSILGHDLRTPLSAIRLSADAIVRLADSRALRPAARILSSTERMSRMIEQLLDLARVRQGQGIPLKLEPWNLGEISRAVVREIEDAHPEAEIELVETGDLDGRWDNDRLGQVLSNLVGNAVQHGAPNHPVRVEVDGTEPGRVRVRIHNEGVVPSASLPTLFEPFKVPSKEGRRSSLGLGLFIAQAIAHAHGGEIEVRSSDAHGTTFELTLPRRPASAFEVSHLSH